MLDIDCNIFTNKLLYQAFMLHNSTLLFPNVLGSCADVLNGNMSNTFYSGMYLKINLKCL